MDKTVSVLMPIDTPIQTNDLIRTNLQPGIFRVTRVLNKSFIYVETTSWVIEKVNGKQHRRRSKIEIHVPRAAIIEIRRLKSDTRS
jgi:hypothetical protein